MSETMDTLICPFCETRYVMAKPGKTCCSVCKTEFEVDDRLECVFADPDIVRLPLRGIVCSACGLVQGGDTNSCLYCGMSINTALQ